MKMLKVISNKASQLSEIEIAVNDLLQLKGFNISYTYCGESKMNGEGQKMDKFSCTIKNCRGAIEIFDFYTGFGHRKNVKSFGSLIGYNVVYPTNASLLHSLQLDADCGGMSFKGFCDDFGYDYDSIKHLNLHRKCESLAEQFNNVFPAHVREELRELLQDY